MRSAGHGRPEAQPDPAGCAGPSRRQGCPVTKASTGGASGAPAGTPPAIVAKLHDAIAEIQSADDTKKQFATQGADIVQMSSADFGAFLVEGNEQVGKAS